MTGGTFTARKEGPGGLGGLDPAFDIVVELAALVHDVQDWKYSGDPDAGTRAIARDVAGRTRIWTSGYIDPSQNKVRIMSQRPNSKTSQNKKYGVTSYMSGIRTRMRV